MLKVPAGMRIMPVGADVGGEASETRGRRTTAMAKRMEGKYIRAIQVSPVRDRNSVIAQLADRPLDLLVVGGGIVGAGVARDAAMRGLRVGLVEQYDFASGTS